MCEKRLDAEGCRNRPLYTLTCVARSSGVPLLVFDVCALASRVRAGGFVLTQAWQLDLNPAVSLNGDAGRRATPGNRSPNRLTAPVCF